MYLLNPLDPKGIVYDALLEHANLEPFDEPTNFNTLLKLSENRHEYGAYMSRPCPTEYLHEIFNPCDILDKDMNIINNTCHNPKQAFKIIEELVKEEGSRFEDYAILDLRTLHCIPLHKVMT